MAMGLFEQLNWLTTRVKRLCCAVEQIQQSGAGSYKVYTALLTQSGTDDTIPKNSGSLTIGVTYYINDNIGGDFTNVGAPNNNNGTYFVATGTTPNTWGDVSGGNNPLIYNPGAPVATVLENTIGNIWFTYGGDGFYQVSSDILFPVGKTVSFIGSAGDDSATPSYGFLRFNSSYFYILTQDSAQTDANGVLNNTPIEIRVYN